MIERFGLAFLNRIDPETAHGLTLRALHTPFVRQPGPVQSPRLETKIGDLVLPNPVGLAAGFDKNALVPGPLLGAGFGFVEVGTLTPRPQPGNPRPRIFRLPEDGAVINRLGFNNEGAEAARGGASQPLSPAPPPAVSASGSLSAGARCGSGFGSGVGCRLRTIHTRWTWERASSR